MTGNGDLHRYDDIIALPHHSSKVRPHMSMRDRAAQFAPFAALTGHSAVLADKARLTEARRDLDEYEIIALERKLQEIQRKISSGPLVDVTWFRKDERKDGGAYLKKTGVAKRIDGYEKKLVLADGEEIPLTDIVDIEEKNPQ